MLRKIVSGTALMLLLISIATFSIQTIRAEPRTWTVDDDGPADFHTIQEAINAANPGDTIFVKTGTYYENVVANKSVLLIGEDPTTTIVDGGGSPVRVVEITANAVAVKNFTIRNNCQVLSWESNNCIYVSDSNDTLIQNNVLTSEGGYGGGIVIYGSANNNISQNIIKTTPNIGVRLYDCSDNTIFRNDITNSSGIYLTSSSNNVISENTITGYNEGNGVELGGCTYNSVSRNTIKNMTWGMILSWSSYNTIFENIITKNKEYGVASFGSNYNNISENIVTANKYDGILLNQLSDNNSVNRNIITNSGQAGVALASSSYNVIFENNITNNRFGIRFVRWETYSNSSKFYHNNFINNTKQVHAFFKDDYSINVWDDGYPSGGNYWSDYAGVDSDYDGIGDSWYEIDSSNIDHHPLMGTFSDFKVTLEHHVQTICNSSISDFQFNDTAIIFNVTGEDGTTGFCRICVPTGLMNVTYRVFVNGTEVSCNLLPCSNSTHSYLYFNYTHSTQEVIIIPEFSSLIILPLFIIATLLAVIVYRRKHTI